MKSVVMFVITLVVSIWATNKIVDKLDDIAECIWRYGKP